MNKSEFESALNTVVTKSTDDRYWGALFCDDNEEFVSNIYTEVIRAAVLQFRTDYNLRWLRLAGLCSALLFPGASGSVESVADGLERVHEILKDTKRMRELVRDADVLPEFAWLMLFGMDARREGVRVMQFLDCVDHDLAELVIAYWKDHVFDNRFSAALAITAAAKVRPYICPVNYTNGVRADWEGAFGIIPMMESALQQASDLYVGFVSSNTGYLIPDHEHGFGSETGLDPFDIPKGEVPDDLYESWGQERDAWVEDAMQVLKTPLRSMAKTYEGYCQSLTRRHADVPYEELCQRMYSFYAAVQSIYNWWKNAASVAAAPKDGGYVLGTLNESDLMRSWLE